jgi:hypothetical protein
MFGSAMFDVFIGVTFVYLAVALVCTAVSELLASVFQWRAKDLERAVGRLLGEAIDGEGQGGALAAKLYAHPLLQSLSSHATRRPSYIPSRTFAVALMDLVRKRAAEAGAADATAGSGETTLVDIRGWLKHLPAGHLQDALTTLVNEADNALAKGRALGERDIVDIQRVDTAMNQVHEHVETWFNNTMERASGWFKRKTQVVTVAAGLTVAAVLNVDTVAIARALAINPGLRQTLSEAALKAAQSPASSTASPAPTRTAEERAGTAQEGVERAAQRLAGLSLPIGWDAAAIPVGGAEWLAKVMGILLTAIAASLGAPFWFDVLNRFILIRGTGKAPEEKPKAPREIPRPLAPGGQERVVPAAPAGK